MSDTDKLDGLLKGLETGAASILDNAGTLSAQIEADLPGVAAKLVAAVHILQVFAVSAHGLLSQFFPSNTLPHPTLEGAVAAVQIAPAVTAAADAGA